MGSSPTIEPLPIQILGLELLPGFVAVDFEAFYDSEVTLKKFHPWHYCRHPLGDTYLVSIVGRKPDGTKVEYVGHPADFAWETISDCQWLSHNVGYDRNAYRALREKDPGIYPQEPAKWHCTGNMAVFLGGQRNLAGASEHMLGIRVSKEIRDVAMRGKRWHEFAPDMQAKVMRYALIDSYLCAGLWARYSHLWPEVERRVSDHSYIVGDRGLTLAVDKVDESIRALDTAMHTAELLIPWRHEEALLSHKAFRAACRAIGLVPPQSLAMDNEDTDAWFDAHGDDAPFASAMRLWRRANALQKKLHTFKSRLKTDGRMAFSLMYFGAHSGRWAGNGGINMQNLFKNSQYLMEDGRLLIDGVDHFAVSKALKEGAEVLGLKHEINIRSKFVAAPGHKFVIVDLAQIEARVLPWLAGDTETVKLMETGMSVYEIHARKSMGWTGGSLKRENPSLYALAKARVLALGFGAGYLKFISMAWMYIEDPALMEQIFGKPITDQDIEEFVHSQTWWVKDPIKKEEWLTEWGGLSEKDRRWWVNSWKQVTDFRKNNPLIKGLWSVLQDDIKSHARDHKDYEVALPSGRKLYYFQPTMAKGEIMVRYQRGAEPHYVYGGLLTENITQGTARDVLAEAIIRIEDAGIRVVHHVHDEVVCEVPIDFDSKCVLEMMRVRPAWAKSLPIDAELQESFCYIK